LTGLQIGTPKRVFQAWVILGVLLLVMLLARVPVLSMLVCVL